MSFDIDPVTRRPWKLKKDRILSNFLSGQSWNTIDAVQHLHTTCLHSDISGLEKKYGLKFSHDRITVAGYGGAKTSVVNYTLLPESYALARRLLGLVTPQDPTQGDEARAYLLASGA